MVGKKGKIKVEKCDACEKERATFHPTFLLLPIPPPPIHHCNRGRGIWSIIKPFRFLLFLFPIFLVSINSEYNNCCVIAFWSPDNYTCSSFTRLIDQHYIWIYALVNNESTKIRMKIRGEPWQQSRPNKRVLCFGGDCGRIRSPVSMLIQLTKCAPGNLIKRYDFGARVGIRIILPRTF